MNPSIRSALLVFVCLSAATVATAQAPPELSKAQRSLLQSVVLAVDAAAAQPDTPDLDWPVHVMRASDGSHYVAFSVAPPAPHQLPAGPVVLYLRLATAATGVTTQTERSAIRDWLVGRRVDPRLLPGRGIAVGEMPAFGAGAIAVRGSTPSSGSTDLKLMEMERERARQNKEDRDRVRRAELEGQAMGLRETLPFEDFDLASASTAGNGDRIISRAFTAGPGDYHLFVAWADPAAKPARIQVFRRSLNLPAATTTELTISSVIVADSVSVRDVPYSPAEQAAHPYTIGPTEIIPARDVSFTPAERLAVAFQIINARPGATGKPDVTVAFRIVRIEGERETLVASLTPQSYSDTSMPADFDLRLGHPLFAAVAAPLTTVPRGDYRLRILVTDRLAGTSRSADAAFSIVGTPLTLLAEAPLLGLPFRRDEILEPAFLQAALTLLAPAAPSPPLQRALEAAAAGRFIELMVEETVPAAEQAVRSALAGLALYAVGDTSAAVTLQRALQMGANAAPVQLWIGAARAGQARDTEAIAAWRSALDAGLAPSLVAPLLVNAHLRRGEGARAADLVAAHSTGGPTGPAWSRTVAATRIAIGDYPGALAVLSPRLAEAPDDGDAQWLMLHSLYGSLVKGASRDQRLLFATAVRNYRGPHQALAAEWLKTIGEP